MKNILFLATGMTPPIITETMWALACDPNNDNPWIPDEIHILSTNGGINKIQKILFDKGVFEKFKTDYPILQNVEFHQDFLHVIQKDGISLEDLKTPVDNELVADMICQKVRQFTQNDEVCLHVSIAGGRKTMGFYAGYALSLYGRSQDRMSHVLVQEDYEGADDFYYPTPHDDYVKHGKSKRLLNAKDAKVWLADIPFVRMSHAISDKHQLKNTDKSFSEVVCQINESFNPVSVRIDLGKNQIIVNDKIVIADLPPREFAMFHWFASLKKQGKSGIIAPKANMSSKNISGSDAQYIMQLSTEFLHYYEDLKNLDDKTIDVDKSFFESVKSLLKSALEERLGLELAKKLELKQDGRGKPFYLDIRSEDIDIIDNFHQGK